MKAAKLATALAACLLAAAAAAAAAPAGGRAVITFAPGAGPAVAAELAAAGAKLLAQGPGFFTVDVHSLAGGARGGAGRAKEAAFVSSRVRARTHTAARSCCSHSAADYVVCKWAARLTPLVIAQRAPASC